MKELRGIFPAMVTPFTANDELDGEGFRWICKNAIASGVHGLILNGSLGEFPALSAAERRRIIEIAVEEAGRRLPVIVGVGSPATNAAVGLAREAAELGADLLMVLPPFYYQIGEEATFAHFKTVAESVDIPIILYNFPGTTKINLSPPLVAKLAAVDRIVGIKNSVDSVVHLRELVRLTQGKEFSVMAGMEDLLLAGLMLGAKGSASGLSNFVPQVLVQIYDSFTRGDVTKASDLFNRVVVPLKVLAPAPEPISALKIGVKLVSGMTTSHVRYPLLDAPQGTESRMEEILLENGLMPMRSGRAK